MQDSIRAANSFLAAEYTASHSYHVYGCRGRFYAACLCGGGHVAKGHRMGDLVIFNRRSDAERFVDARNRMCRDAAGLS